MEPLRIHSRLTLPGEELSVSFAKSGGPGGQNVNKVESKVILRFNVRSSRVLGDVRRERLLLALASKLTTTGELIVQASDHRQREENWKAARERLAGLVREALVEPRARRATKPGAGAQRRRLEAKKRTGAIKRSRRAGDDG